MTAGRVRGTGSSRGRVAWNAFLDEVQAGVHRLFEHNGDGGVWFRGQPQRSYPLLPALLRGYFDLTSPRTREHIRQQERWLYHEFRSRVREFYGLVNEDWDNLFAMQQCGVPTRLLEWSESMPIGLFFALYRFEEFPGVPSRVLPEDPPCLWILDPHALNARTAGSPMTNRVVDLQQAPVAAVDDGLRRYSDLLRGEPVLWEEPIAVHPLHRTTQMQLQRSWFTMHGENPTAIDQLPGCESFMVKVDVPPAAGSAAREYLRDGGMDLMTLFRDLPHLGVHLNRTHSRAKRALCRATGM